MIFSEYGHMFSHDLPASIIDVIFDTYEERLDGCCEYVNLNWGVDVLARYFFVYLGNLTDRLVLDANIKEQYSLPSKPMCYVEMFSYFKKLVSKWNDAQYCLAETYFKIYFNDPESRGIISKAYTAAKLIADSLEATFKQFPEVFLPRASISSPKHPITIRVFEDRSDRFVIKSNLMKELNIETAEEENKDVMETISFDEAKSLFGSRFNGIEFIRFEINRAKHAAVPIWGPTGGHCILAADALIQFLRSLIFKFKVFQNVTGERWSYIQKCLSETPFTPTYKFRFFIMINHFKRIGGAIIRHLCVTPRSGLKDVRNAKKDGFTEQNLKNELTHLGLPGIS
uniref:RGS domain-containing protein n=1 Tax=Caenorhabditis tropicalis TaxID=1561998 RepID=A0A1I7U921_9PELO